MIEPPLDEKNQGQGLLPPDFPKDYVEGAVKPFLVSTSAVGDVPLLPMIDLAYSKRQAIPPHIWGMLYDSWTPQLEAEGLSVFLQAYEDRGRDNARKKIYYSAMTADLCDSLYAPKIQAMVDYVLAEEGAGEPVMQRYLDQYPDMYWDLHLGVRGDAIPEGVRSFSTDFNTVLGYWFPTHEVVRDAYGRVRAEREALKSWADAGLQDVLDQETEGFEATFVHHWAKNGGLGPDFRREDIVFESFHNFLAFSQWGNTYYNVMRLLSTDRGDPVVRSAFEATMAGTPDIVDEGAFTPLDRFVMELMRVISPNAGSYSTLSLDKGFLGEGYAGISHSHPAASRDPRHWTDPDAFNPDRYKTAPTADRHGEDTASKLGLARCPFAPAPRPVEDGRDTVVTNSAFGAVYSVTDGRTTPVCETAGYAPFGFGYRRCAGEVLTVESIKALLRAVHSRKLTFSAFAGDAKQLAVGPGTVIKDDIVFTIG